VNTIIPEEYHTLKTMLYTVLRVLATPLINNGHLKSEQLNRTT
jgi:hypothetical protein